MNIKTARLIKSKAIVDVQKNKDGLNELIAFVCDSEILKDDLEKILSKSLPEYMLPSKYVFVENLPLTINGKIDKSALLSLV